MGADERLRQEFLANPFFTNGDTPGHEWDFGRYRTRAWTKITPTDTLEFNARLSWEWRYWECPIQNQTINGTTLDLTR